MRNIIGSFCFLLLTMQALAQQTEKIETDRPSESESPFVVPNKWLQFEMGFSLQEEEGGIRTILHPSLLSKYGIGNRFEIRLITEWETIETLMLIPSGNEFISGLKPVKLGGKLLLLEEKGALPKTAFIFQTSIPHLATAKMKENRWLPDFRLAMQNSLSKTVNLGYNIGAEWREEEKSPFFHYSISPGIDLGEKWYAFVEVYGYINSGTDPDHVFDGGFAFTPTSNTRLDLSAGFGLGNSDPRYFASLGFSFRLPTSSKH